MLQAVWGVVCTLMKCGRVSWPRQDSITFCLERQEGQVVWNSLHCGCLHYHFSNKVSSHLWGECQVNTKTIYLIRTGSDTRKPRGAEEDVQSIIALYLFLFISHLKRLCVCSSKCIQIVNNILLSYAVLPSLETIQNFSNCAACNTKTQACVSLRN